MDDVKEYIAQIKSKYVDNVKEAIKVLEIPSTLVNYINNITNINLSDDTESRIEDFIKIVSSDNETFFKFVILTDVYARDNATFKQIITFHSFARQHSKEYDTICNNVLTHTSDLYTSYAKMESVWMEHLKMLKRGK